MSVIAVKVPQFGESLSEGRISRWLKADGDIVKEDEPLFELETDKATPEIPAPASGKLRILIAEGTTVAVDSIVAEIDTSVTAGAVSPPSKEPEHPTASKVALPASGAMSAEVSTSPRSSPAAARLMAEHTLQPHQIRGTGPAGLITKGDVQAVIDAQAAPSRPANGSPIETNVFPVASERPSATRLERKPMTMIRKRIAERLLESQNTTATLTTFNEADLSAVMAWRTKHNERFEKKHGVKLGFMSFFVKAAIASLKAFPVMNARIDGSDIVYQHFYDIGVAVSTDRGLVVPVLRDADQMSIGDIEKAIADVARRAREGKISVNEMEGGTFTITNGGIFGSLLSTPILNPPQSAILGMHAIQKRPVVLDDQIVIRPMMYLALSYDHRLIDGREAVQFLVHIKECVENPERMLLDI